MTGTEMKAIITEKRGKGQELLAIMFDNSLYTFYIGDDIFDLTNIKAIGGEDCVETDNLYFNSQIIGEPKIKMTTVHKVECVQALMFVDADRKKEVSPRDLRFNYV